jgi:adenylate kinase family enzyme
MLDYYAAREELVSVDGSQPVEEVTKAVIDALEVLRPRLS